jgi:UDP-glucose 4-epimerase
MLKVLVTGGAGYIGSVITEELVNQGNEVVVYDNLTKGHQEMVHPKAKFFEGDIADEARVRSVLSKNGITAVIHMAAFSLVGESVTDPQKYYQNNVVSGLSFLNSLVASNVKNIVFSSTAAVYGEPEKQPIEETDRTEPTNPYGATKLAFEKALHAYSHAYGIQYVCLRYFNAAGATQLCGEQHDPETHLIPILLQVAAGEREFVTIFGSDYPTPDGTCVRDYIHVRDLAQAHILSLKALADGVVKQSIFNLGCGDKGYSVKEVISATEKVTGKKIPIKMGERRSGDPATLIASSQKISKELGFKPLHQDIESIIRSAWEWKKARS